MGIEEITINPLEKVTDSTAVPTDECGYPNCERCTHYVGYRGDKYCTVPMVVNKQIWHITASKLRRLEKCMAELQTAFYDEILGVRDDNDTDARRL